MRLSGYGVELQMKSTEYKAQDDSIVDDKKKDSNEDQSASSEEETEIEGFNFNVLKYVNPLRFRICSRYCFVTSYFAML